MVMKLAHIIIFLLISISIKAQQVDSTHSPISKLYLGISFSSVSHHIYYRTSNAPAHVQSVYFAPLALNLGYQLTDKTRLQAGLAYGGNSDSHDWVNGQTETSHKQTGHAIAIPLTVQHNVLKAWRRFPIYGTATLMPAWGITKYETKETVNGTNATTNKGKVSGADVFFTAGVGFNYKISNRIEGLAEYVPFRHNLTGENSIFYDWDYGLRGSLKIIKSLKVGVNYKL